jgi:hypothetical protein
MEIREFKGAVKCVNGRRFFYAADWQTECPREWVAYVIRADAAGCDPRERYCIKVSGPTVFLPLTTPDDIADQINGQLGEFLERNPEVWDLTGVEAWVGDTLPKRS